MYAYEILEYVSVRDVILGEHTPFDIGTLYEDVQKIEKSVKVMDYIKEYPMHRLFSVKVIDSTFKCFFFPENLAWFSSYNGHCRYFTRNYKGKVCSYDLLDFLFTYYQTENFQTIEYLLTNNSEVIFLDKKWRKIQENKYANNIKTSKIISEKDLISFKILSSHLNVYRELNELAFTHLGPMHLSYGRDAMFFVSSRYLGERMGKGASTVLRSCRFLASLGLINIVPEENIPASYLKMSKSYQGKKNRIHYYSILDLEKNWDKITEKCLEYAKRGITASNLTSQN